MFLSDFAHGTTVSNWQADSCQWRQTKLLPSPASVSLGLLFTYNIFGADIFLLAILKHFTDSQVIEAYHEVISDQITIDQAFLPFGFFMSQISFQVWQCRLRTVIQNYMSFNVIRLAWRQCVVRHCIQSVLKVASLSNRYWRVSCQWLHPICNFSGQPSSPEFGCVTCV